MYRYKSVWSSDAPTSSEDSTEKDRLSVEEHNSSDPIDEDLTSSRSMNQLDTIESCFSLSSSSMGIGTTDSMMDSSEETDHIKGDVTGIDFKLRIRRYNEETAHLRNELDRAEEIIAALQHEIKSSKKDLEKKIDNYVQLQKENEELKETLNEAERREESCKLELRKLEKAYVSLQKKVKQLELEKENVSALKTKIEELTKDISKYIKQIRDYKNKYDEKLLEFEYLQEQFNELQSNNCKMEESFNKNLQHHQEKIQELQNLNEELMTKMNGSDNSSRLSLTPPPYGFTNHIHSTPYSNKLRHTDSIYSELKASGFNVDDASKIHQLKEELSFYNEEIAIISEKIDEALQDIAASRNEICVPSVQLVETDGIQTLKQKISTLLDLVKTSTAVKAPLAPKIGEDSREKPDILPEPKKTSGLSYDRLFRPETQENDLIGTVSSSMTLAPETSRFCDKSTSPVPEIVLPSPEHSLEATSEEVIVPIVEALSRIIEIKGTDDEDNVFQIKRPLPRYPKPKSIFTTKYKPSKDWFSVYSAPSSSNLTPVVNVEGDSKSSVFAEGDGSHSDFVKTRDPNSLTPQIINNSEMKTLKSEFKDYNNSQEEVAKKIDTRFVTLRPCEKTYTVSPIVSSTGEKLEFEQSKVDDLKLENTYIPTPFSTPKGIPRRKLSVYNRSFDVDNLQTPDSVLSTSGEKRRSISASGVQEDLRGKSIQPLESSITTNQLLTTYRCANSSDSSMSPSPKKDDLALMLEYDDSPFSEKNSIPKRISRPVFIAPTKFMPDSTVNQTQTINREINTQPDVTQGILQRNYPFRKINENEAAHQSAILSSSPNLTRKVESKDANDAKQQSRILSSSENLVEKEKCDIKPDETQQTEKINVEPDKIHGTRIMSSSGELAGKEKNTEKTYMVRQSRILSSSENIAKKEENNKTYDVVQQSRILSSSGNMVKKEEGQLKNDLSKFLSSTTNTEHKEEKEANNDQDLFLKISNSTANSTKEENDKKNCEPSITLNSYDVGSSRNSSEPSYSSSTTDILDNSCGSLNNSDNVFLTRDLKGYDQTYTKKGAEETPASQRATSNATFAVSVKAPVVATASEQQQASLCCSGGGADEQSSRAPAVARAMSSGEDSSAESECDTRPTAAFTGDKKNKTESLDCSVIEVDSSGKPILAYTRGSNSCIEETKCKAKDYTGTAVQTREDKVEVPPTMNGDDKDNSCRKVSSNSSPQEAIKEDENPKAFPSWTDEKLQESEIASYTNLDSEMSENLPEEELKKKYTAFSVGLSTDRMTLSKRVLLSRRHRDQSEKNFTNEVQRMQQNIKELAPLCVDSESVERVERAKQQLEMVARCAHRISCTGETLGAVHQERRVSRAVLLADRYLQTLRHKCEKLAAELAETKKILAENNIVLEENLSELGDDVPRVRYRAVPNNNRTMEIPRQRNSVSGRVPGLRRPSLCYETPKWEIEKLDRADSSSSIAELRDIFEQAESRRHSREENNNLIRTSVNNLSTITSEQVEEEEVWSNTQEDIVPESSNENDINSHELGQHRRHPLICWLRSRYEAWKLMIWGIFIAFILGIIADRVVSSSRRNGPPLSWWSIEEILNQYIQVENEKSSIPRPI